MQSTPPKALLPSVAVSTRRWRVPGGSRAARAPSQVSLLMVAETWPTLHLSSKLLHSSPPSARMPACQEWHTHKQRHLQQTTGNGVSRCRRSPLESQACALATRGSLEAAAVAAERRHRRVSEHCGTSALHVSHLASLHARMFREWLPVPQAQVLQNFGQEVLGKLLRPANTSGPRVFQVSHNDKLGLAGSAPVLDSAGQVSLKYGYSRCLWTRFFST